jgi:hypothetical protein
VNATIRKGAHIISHYKKVLKDVKGILVNFDEPLAPRQITTIEEITGWVVKEQKKWCAGFDAFIAEKSADLKRNVSKEPRVEKLREQIFSFRYLFNKLSVNYKSIIYFQRLYAARKIDLESKKKYYAILRKHQLIPKNKESTENTPTQPHKKEPKIEI